MATPQTQTVRPPLTNHVRYYRLVDRQGAPHPVLDDLYESLDAAWTEAMGWWQEHLFLIHLRLFLLIANV